MPPALILTLISAAIAGAAGFGLAWRLQTATILEMENAAKDTRIAAQRVARQAIERATTNVITAQNNATARAHVLRAAADTAKSELDGLRSASASAMRAAATSLDACNATAATASELLNQCAAEYQALGAKADGHVSDLQTLKEARAQ